MKKNLIFFLALIFLAPSLSASGMVTFKIGYFIPRADSDLWQTEFDQMTFKKSHFQNTNFGFAYEYFITRQVGLTLSVDGYNKNKVGQYYDYVGYSGTTLGTVDDFAFPIDYEGDFIPAHTFNVSITPIQLSLKFHPLGRKGKFLPYVGGGVGIYIWRVRLIGDMIDFSDEWIYDDPVEGEIIVYPIYLVNVREDTKLAIGYHGLAGIMFPVAQRFTLEAEFKYNFSQGDLKDFEGFEPFDLGGYQISFGINYWF